MMDGKTMIGLFFAAAFARRGKPPRSNKHQIVSGLSHMSVSTAVDMRWFSAGQPSWHYWTKSLCFNVV